MSISVVVPLFNEAESLPHLLTAVADVLDKRKEPWEIIFVNDGSSDSSAQVLKELSLLRPQNVRLVRFSRNFGKSAALSAGIERAAGTVIVTMDADLQDDPVAIPEMISLLDAGWDMVSGWKKTRHDPLFAKTIPSRGWNLITSALTGLKLHDFNCGFKAYRAETAKSLDIYGERHRYLPVLAHWNGYRVTEIPVPHHARKFGKSKFGASRMLKGVLDLLTLLFLRTYLKKPLHFFGLLGLFCGLAGAAVLAYFGFQWIQTGQMHIRPLMLLAVGSIIMGIQFVSIGLIGEMITNANPSRSFSVREEIGAGLMDARD
jgi:glycosyltransferase involved in cell wall biosynthesis